MKIYLVAGEPSGDHLGASLIQALRLHNKSIELCGVGGTHMQAQGLQSLFPMHDIAVMGVSAVIARLPTLLNRIKITAQDIIAQNPDALIIIDSPDFCHRVAKKVRKSAPHIKIIGYVSPTVWAWRSGRAKKMRAFMDHLLAILPFEPKVHETLGGPPTTYVGHPLIEKNELINLSSTEKTARETEPFTLLVLPGSRRMEIERLMPVFGETLQKLHAINPNIKPILPAVEHLLPLIESHINTWTIKPTLITGEQQKYAAMRMARAALAASGTVTLELALGQVPFVVAYKVAPLETLLKYLIKVSSIVLPNIILGQKVFPEFIQEQATAQNLCNALAPLLENFEQRKAQMNACKDLLSLMQLQKINPASLAAKTIFKVIQE